MTALERPVLTLAQLEAFDPHPGGGPAERRFCCPLDGCRGKPVDHGHQSLCLNTDSGLWTCFRCGATGKVRERWDERSVQDVRRARARAAFTLAPERPPGTAQTAALVPQLLERCHPVAGTAGEAYLFGRGIEVATATAAGVRYTRDCYRRPGVVFPMHDRTGQLVAVNVRHTDPRVPKTHSLGDRSLGVFATAGALAAGIPLVVVEGPLDALSLAECGLPAVAVVATRAPRWLGSAAVFRRVYVALDADAAGDAHSPVLMEELRPYARSVARLRPPSGKDWNDALLADYVGLCAFLDEHLER